MTSHSVAPSPQPTTVLSSRQRTASVVRRCAKAAGSLAVTALLTACGAGSGPLVTVFTPGGGSVSVSPLCWNDQEAVDRDGCEAALAKVGQLEVQPGDTIGISVDKALIERGGWIPRVSGQPLVTAPLTGSYYRFAIDEASFAAAENQELELVVLAASEDGTTDRGLWVVQLNRR